MFSCPGASAPVALATLHQVASGATEPWVAPVEAAPEDSAVSAASAPDIDWGVADSQPVADIDWDAAFEDGGGVDQETGGLDKGPLDSIDWDICIEDGHAGQAPGVAATDAAAPTDVAAPPSTASVAAVRLAEDATYRASLTDDVLELLAFLKTRLAAMQRSGTEALPLGTKRTGGGCGAC